jgi:putative endonuclease
MRWLCRLADAARHRARLKTWEPGQAAGRRGEDMAHRYLERRGFTVVARNYRPPAGGGEIDLVAWEGKTLVFVEVKSRASNEFGAPERNIGPEKRDALLRAGRNYARRAGVPFESARFDVVSILLTDPPAITHAPDAFAPGRTL